MNLMKGGNLKKIIISAGVVLLGGVVGGVILYFRPLQSPSPPASTQPTPLPSPHNTPTPGNPRLENPTTDYQEKIKQNQTPENTVRVIITSSGFSPATVKIRLGGIVTWENQDSQEHQITGESGFWGTKLKLKKGQKFSQQFDVPGEYPYFCSLTPKLKGKVIVLP